MVLRSRELHTRNDDEWHDCWKMKMVDHHVFMKVLREILRLVYETESGTEQ